MAKRNEITLTINEHKAAVAIVAEAKNLKTAYGSLGAAVRAFVGDDLTFDQMQARGKLFRSSPEYKGAAADIQAACRKAFQRMMDAAFPNRERKARGARPEGNAKAAAPAKEKIVKKIEHVLPDWAKDMPPLVAAWCEDHPIAALAAIRAAYDRDVQQLKVA